MKSNETILAIDDDEAILNSFFVYLSDCGYRVLTADSGEEGLKKFQSEQPDLVLVDLLMPHIDGFEVISQINKSSPDTPLVVVSGIGEIDNAMRAIRLGAWDYLTKPIEDMPSLRHTIFKVLERAQLIRENREYREKLEEKVKLRTFELSVANENLTRLNEKLRKIVESTRNLSISHSVDQFSRHLLAEYAHLIQAEGGSFYLTEEKGLHLMHALDPGHAPPIIPFPLREGSIFETVYKKQSPLLVEDITKVPSLVPSGWEQYRNRSSLTFPLVDESQFVIGVLALHNKGTFNFNNQDKEIGSILASYSCETLKAVRAAEEVSESEKRLGLAIHGADLGTWDWLVEDDRVMVNEQWVNMTGYSLEDFGRSRSGWENIIHPEDLPMVTRAMNDHLAGKTDSYDTEYRIKRKSGELIWVLDKGKVTEKDDSNNPLRVCGTYLNITARKQAK